MAALLPGRHAWAAGRRAEAAVPRVQVAVPLAEVALLHVEVAGLRAEAVALRGEAAGRWHVEAADDAPSAVHRGTTAGCGSNCPSSFRWQR